MKPRTILSDKLPSQCNSPVLLEILKFVYYLLEGGLPRVYRALQNVIVGAESQKQG